MPGLDGMRALAVVAVMIYHANSDWLKGGFLGVEVFFVISGYLITLLLISENERDHSVDMKQFWIRRARRLLPALFVMLFALTIWTALFERSTLGKLRGDIVAALGYVSNWYQVWTRGRATRAANDFAPLRHLWSLAVEEQFYLVWPVVMLLLLRAAAGDRRSQPVARSVAVAHHGAVARCSTPGPIGTPEVTPGRLLEHLRARHLQDRHALPGTLSRAGGLLLGAAFAMMWRPDGDDARPAARPRVACSTWWRCSASRCSAMMWRIGLIGPDGADPWLFRGGFFLSAHRDAVR